MIVWLASYPKSGNTWVRSIISSLLYTEDGIFDFTLLSKIPKFPNKSYFKHLQMILGILIKLRNIGFQLKKN